MIKLRCHRRRGSLRKVYGGRTKCSTVFDKHLQPCGLEIHLFLPVFTVIITSAIK